MILYLKLWQTLVLPYIVSFWHLTGTQRLSIFPQPCVSQTRNQCLLLNDSCVTFGNRVPEKKKFLHMRLSVLDSVSVKGKRERTKDGSLLELTLHKYVLTATSVKWASRQLTTPDPLQLFHLSPQIFTASEILRWRQKLRQYRKKKNQRIWRSGFASELLFIKSLSCTTTAWTRNAVIKN